MGEHGEIPGLLSGWCCGTGGPRSSDSGSQLERGLSDLKEPRGSLTMARNPSAASDPAKPKVSSHTAIPPASITCHPFVVSALAPACYALPVVFAACHSAAASFLQSVSASRALAIVSIPELFSHALTACTICLDCCAPSHHGQVEFVMLTVMHGW